MKTCRTCRFYDYSQCRRHPPQIVRADPSDAFGGSYPRSYIEFPGTSADGWCGEWRLRWSLVLSGVRKLLGDALRVLRYDTGKKT